MTKNVIKTMLVLVVVYLVAWYVLKFFFPDWFLLQINNERLIEIGKFIDNHYLLDKLFGLVLFYITYTLYLGALCEFKYLDLKKSLIVCLVYLVSCLIEHFCIEYLTYVGQFNKND